MLSKNLTPIDNEINELSESVSKTLMAINSDTLNGTLDIYAAVKQNKELCYQSLRRLPGKPLAKETLIERLQLAISALEKAEQQKAYKLGLKAGARMRSWLEE